MKQCLGNSDKIIANLPKDIADQESIDEEGFKTYIEDLAKAYFNLADSMAECGEFIALANGLEIGEENTNIYMVLGRPRSISYSEEGAFVNGADVTQTLHDV